MSDFSSIAATLKIRSGLSLTADKDYLVRARLEPILKRRAFASLSVLADHMRNDPALEREVVEAMTTNETLFFRDVRPFDHLRDEALPRLVRTRQKGSPIRIWSAAASTGQEAYSLAMLIAELGHALKGVPVEIVGTDIARQPLARAEAGLYSLFEIQRGLPPHLLARYFTKEDSGWRINAQIRSMVRFREWNLLADLAGLGRFDIVFCRNVLIYFDQATKARVLDAIARQMAPDGLLYVGGAETAVGLNRELGQVAGRHGIFQKTAPAEAVLLRS